MYEISYGNKYAQTRDLDIAEVAKLVRKDIKKAHPSIKTSVRISRFAGGQSLDIRIKSMAGGASPYTPVYLEAQATRNWNIVLGKGRYTQDAFALQKNLEALVEAYNYDGSDMQSDYFNVRFYTSVDFE